MSAWTDQWATLFFVVIGRRPLAQEEVLELVGPLLRERFKSSQYPALQTIEPRFVEDEWGGFTIEGGPYDGVPTETDGPYLTAIKWNVRSRDDRKITNEELGEARTALRRSTPSLRQSVRDAGYVLHGSGLKRYGEPITGDRGIPSRPPLPPKPRPAIMADAAPPATAAKRFPWGPVLGGVVAMIAIANS